MIIETSTVTFRENLSKMLHLVHHCRDSVLINKNGKPVAALINIRLFERIRRMQEKFDALSQRIEAGFAGVSEVDSAAEIEAAIAEDREAQRKHASG